MKRELIITTFRIAGVLCVASALLILVLGAIWIPNVPDLAFLIPFFGGASLFFVGTYIEAKYSDTYGIPMYISNRKVLMRSCVLGGALCIASTVASIINIL